MDFSKIEIENLYDYDKYSNVFKIVFQLGNRLLEREYDDIFSFAEDPESIDYRKRLDIYIQFFTNKAADVLSDYLYEKISRDKVFDTKSEIIKSIRKSDAVEMFIKTANSNISNLYYNDEIDASIYKEVTKNSILWNL